MGDNYNRSYELDRQLQEQAGSGHSSDWLFEDPRRFDEVAVGGPNYQAGRRTGQSAC